MLIISQQYTRTKLHTVDIYGVFFRYSRPTNYVMVNTHENNWIQFKHKFFLSLWHPGESEIVHFFFPVLWRTLTLSSSDVSSCMCVFYHLIKKVIAFSLLVLAITFFKHRVFRNNKVEKKQYITCKQLKIDFTNRNYNRYHTFKKYG